MKLTTSHILAIACLGFVFLGAAVALSNFQTGGNALGQASAKPLASPDADRPFDVTPGSLTLAADQSAPKSAGAPQETESLDVLTNLGLAKQSSELQPCFLSRFPWADTPRRQALAAFAIPKMLDAVSQTYDVVAHLGSSNRRRQVQLPSGDKLTIWISEHAFWPEGYDLADEAVQKEIAEDLNHCIADTARLSWKIDQSVREGFPNLHYALEEKQGEGQTFSLFVAFDSHLLVIGSLMRPPANSSKPVSDEEFELIQEFLVATYDRAVVLGVTAHDPSLASVAARQDVAQRLRAEGFDIQP